MKNLLTSKGLFVLGFVLLAGVNTVVLTGVLSNRSGTPEAEIVLTERELAIPYWKNDENNSLFLELKWRALNPEEKFRYYNFSRNPDWLNAEKLKELDFDTEKYLNPENSKGFKKTMLPKEVFLVLEYDGHAYRTALEKVQKFLEKEAELLDKNKGVKELEDNYKRAKDQYQREKNTYSRLFAIDAGLDPDTLRKKYPDRSKFLIVRGVVKPQFRFNYQKGASNGFIQRLSIERIHVPLEQRRIFDAILPGNAYRKKEMDPPRYEVVLAYGKRLEPWITAIHPLTKTLD